MSRVCVVGGGTAGAEAAREASGWGANVTLIEKAENPGLAWKSWPALIRDPSAVEVPPLSAADRVILASVASAGPGFVRMYDGRRLQSDAVIVATGSRFVPLRLPGLAKKGAHVLDCSSKYPELGRAAESASKAVILGEGSRALQVADRLCGSGRRVRVLVSGWRSGEPSPVVKKVIESAADEAGVSIARGSVEKVVGSDSVEAVVANGSVLPCDLVGLLPPRIPNPPYADARRGPQGGLLVDQFLVASSQGLLAAGGFAELSSEPSGALALDEVTGMSGRVAGANSAGRRMQVDFMVPHEVTAFGLRWTRSGLALGPSPGTRLPLTIVGRRWGPDSACTIAFDRSTGRVLWMESVRPAAESPEELPRLAPGRTLLQALAYGGSSDISMVSDTARLGISEWRKS